MRVRNNSSSHSWSGGAWGVLARREPNMFIQSAELTPAPGRSGDLGPMVTKMRDVLSSETGKQWWSWAALAGRPFGTQLLSTRADGFVDMVATQTKLIGSQAWAALSGGAARGTCGPGRDVPGGGDRHDR